jgi:hypothetical protein
VDDVFEMDIPRRVDGCSILAALRIAQNAAGLAVRADRHDVGGAV